MSNIWRPVDYDSLGSGLVSGLGGISGYQADVSEVIESVMMKSHLLKILTKWMTHEEVKVSDNQILVYLHKHLLITFICVNSKHKTVS